jgi:DMSO/TMAO reductase YedYZ heme-binding membrane subunit
MDRTKHYTGRTVYHTIATLISGQNMKMQDGSVYTIPTLVFVSGIIATLAFIIAIGSFIWRRKLKKSWLAQHRSATVIAIAATIWHLAIWFGQKG